MRHALVLRVTLSFAAAAASAPADAQPAGPAVPVPTSAVVRTIAPTQPTIAVDGVMDEADWDQALHLPLRFEWQPGDNTEPIERTDAYVLFDRESLYIGFKAFDRTPSQIRARLTDRDAAYLDDTVGVMLDTFNDERRAFQFRINPLGVQMDAVNSDVDGSEDWSWDAIWDSAGRLTADGYVVEMRIPFSSLRFPRTTEPQTWGVDVFRDLPRSLRHRMRGARTNRDRACMLCQFDKVSGFRDMSAGHGIEVIPTLTMRRTDRADGGGGLRRGTLRTDAGVTTRWSMTPSVTFNAALHPDFSQIEADVAQLDVNTRFALSYPERRPFFLEGSDLFSTPADLVFTRTVADPDWGLKVSGKEGPHAFGAFVTRDAVANLLFPAIDESASTTLPDTSLTTAVGRYRRDLGRQSNIGALVTSRSGGGYDNLVVSVDGHIRLSDTDGITFQGIQSRTHYPDAVARQFAQPDGRFTGTGYGAHYEHGGRQWGWEASARSLGRRLRADTGFIPRVNTREAQAEIRRIFRGGRDRWFNTVMAGAEANVLYDEDGHLIEQGFDLPIRYEGPRQLQVRYNPAPNFERYNGVAYRNFRHIGFMSVRPTGAVMLQVFTRIGGTIDYANGRRAEGTYLEPRVELSAWRRLNATLQHTFERLTVADGRLFTANLSEARLMYHFDRRTFLRAIVQYRHVDRVAERYRDPVAAKSARLFTQWLFSFKVSPQTVLLAGYSDMHDGTHRLDLTQTNRTFFLKLGYAWVP